MPEEWSRVESCNEDIYEIREIPTFNSKINTQGNLIKKPRFVTSVHHLLSSDQSMSLSKIIKLFY